jgi:hypothetical protein
MREFRFFWQQFLAKRNSSYSFVSEQPLTKKALPRKLFPSLALFFEDSQISHLQETRNIIWISNGLTVGSQAQSYWNEFATYHLEVINRG